MNKYRIHVQFMGMLFVILSGTSVFSQFLERKPVDPTLEPEYLETYQAAAQTYAAGNFKFALPKYLKLYKSNPEDLLINYRLGICYLNITDKSRAIAYLEKSKVLDVRHSHPDLDFFLAEAYHAHHEFDKAIELYSKYRSTLDLKHEFNLELSQEINRLIAQCATGKRLYAAPLKVTMTHLSSKINSPYSEKNPLISFDGNALYFSSGRPQTTGLLIDPSTNQYFDDIYVSTKTREGWTPASQLKGDINTNGNDSPLSITANGKRLYVCSSKNENGSIYYSNIKDSIWSTGIEMDKQINEIDYETGACISSDGKTFYFSSDMDGGYGGDDLYKCQLQADSSWGQPVNLGQEINSTFDEDDPFILKDGKTLYFSSQGHNTMGGYDIFMSKYDDRLKDWEVPSNLGYPINSSEDEISISWSGDGKTGYYSQENEEGFGNEDIYVISLESAPKKDTYISKEVAPPINVQKPSEPKPASIAYTTQPQMGEVLKEQVHFAFNESHTITDYSKNKIGSVITLLQKYPGIALEIEGFTEYTDNHEYNQKVAQGRAYAVYNYMLQKGIPKNRIQVKMLQENQPHSGTMSNPETNIRNRRVQFKIISFK